MVAFGQAHGEKGAAQLALNVGVLTFSGNRPEAAGLGDGFGFG